jgi:hypothetical protein
MIKVKKIYISIKEIDKKKFESLGLIYETRDMNYKIYRKKIKLQQIIKSNLQ